MRQQLRLLEQLEETGALVRSHQPQIEDAWIDLAFPIRVRSPMVGHHACLQQLLDIVRYLRLSACESRFASSSNSGSSEGEMASGTLHTGD